MAAIEGAARPSPPWIFGILELPFGAAVGFCQVFVPWLLAGHGMPIDQIGVISGTTFSPHAWKILWVPLIDVSPWRKAWFLAPALSIGLFLAASSFIEEPGQHMTLLMVLLIGGQSAAATCSAALEALMATTTRPNQKGRAGGFFMAGNVGGSGILGVLPIWLSKHASRPLMAGVLLAIVTATSLPVLLIDERRAPAAHGAAVLGAWGRRIKEILKDLWTTAKSREGITGLVICLAPVGCGALTNLFSGMAKPFGAPDEMVEIVNGIGAGIAGALGSLLGGYLADRMNRRLAYAASGGVTALCALAMAFAPLNATTYAWGTLAYCFANGIAFAAFAGMVLEMVAHGSGVTTKYTLFVAASNQAISYVTALDGYAPGLGRFGAVAPILFDALITFVGIGVLLVMVLISRKPRVAAGPAV